MRVIFLQRLDKLHDLFLNHLLVMKAINIIDPGVNGQNLNPLLPVNPLLMPLMHRLNILQTDILLALPIPDPDPLKTNLRRALQIHNPPNRAVLDQRITQ